MWKTNDGVASDRDHRGYVAVKWLAKRKGEGQTNSYHGKINVEEDI